MTVDPDDTDTPSGRGGRTPRTGERHGPTSRRTFLRAAGATAAATALAGCGGLQERRFVATAAGLTAPSRSYGLTDDSTSTMTVERSVGGTEFRVTVESSMRVYESDTDQPEWVGVLSTPSATVLGRSLNPLAGVPFAELLDTQADQLLGATSFGDDGPVRWASDPAVVGRFEARLLDTDVKGESLAGVADGGDVALVHAARTTHEGDIVLAASVRRYDGGDDPPAQSADSLGRGAVPDGSGVAEQAAAFEETLAAVEHPLNGGKAATPEREDTPTATPEDEDPRAILRDVRREPMGGGRERITGLFGRFEPGVGFVGERVRLDDEGFRAEMAERAPVDSLPAEALGGPGTDDAEGGESASLADRIGQTALAMTAALGWRAGSTSSASRPPDRVSLKSRQTPLKSQGARGTCVSFAVCAALERAYDRAGYPTPDLSEQYLNHLQKMIVLNREGDGQRDPRTGVLTHDGFENLLGTGGGSAVGYQFALLSRYGVPDESEARVQPFSATDPYYVSKGDYEDTGQQGDDPSFQWDDPSSAKQVDVDDFNLTNRFGTFQFSPGGPERLRPFPRDALWNARYGIDSYVLSGAGGLSVSLARDPAWHKGVLAGGREIVIGYSSGRARWAEPRPSREQFGWPASENERPESYDETAHRQAVDDWEARDGNTFVFDPDGSGGGHAVTLVGYDETGDRNHFVAKNSWGVYSKLGYDLFTEDAVSSAGVIMTVRPPETVPIHEQDLLGKYKFTYDGGWGLLHVTRLPGFYDTADLPSGTDPATEDRRIGSFLADDGTLYRVNGEVRPPQTDGTGVETSIGLRFNVDFSEPNQPYDGYGNTTFDTVMHVGRRVVLAGTAVDARNGSRGCFARKPFLFTDEPEGEPRVGARGVDALLGAWSVRSGLVTVSSHLLVTAVDTDRGRFTGRLLDLNARNDRDAYLQPVTGTVDGATGDVRFTLGSDAVGSLATPGSFSGHLHRDRDTCISGIYTTTDDRSPLVLIRRDDVEPYVEIVSPTDGATVDRGGKKGTRLEAFVVGTEGASVRWHVRETGTTSWRIVGHGDSVSAALGSGTYEVEARYDSAAPPNAQTTDRITLTVA